MTWIHYKKGYGLITHLMKMFVCLNGRKSGNGLSTIWWKEWHKFKQVRRGQAAPVLPIYSSHLIGSQTKSNHQAMEIRNWFRMFKIILKIFETKKIKKELGRHSKGPTLVQLIFHLMNVDYQKLTCLADTTCSAYLIRVQWLWSLNSFLW